MKNFKSFFVASLVVLMSAFLVSCQQDDITVSPTGVEFILSPGLVQDDGARMNQDGNEFPTVGEGVCELINAAYVEVVIEGIADELTLPVNQWGVEYKTDLAELEPGTYYILSFVVYNDQGDAIFATPAADSEFGPFVSTALPLQFSVSLYEKTPLIIEVLCVENFTPPQFGFSFWNLDIKATRQLCIWGNSCDPDQNNGLAQMEAWIYPDKQHTEATDLIWGGRTDIEDEDPDNNILCLKFPYDPEIPAEEQIFYVMLQIDNILLTATLSLADIEEINTNAGYIHLNKDCDYNFNLFENTANFRVEPGGEDDTQAMLQAFALAKAAGPGSVVELVEGEYFIDFIEIREFKGKFIGAGKGKTIITPAEELAIEDLIDLYLNTILIRFVGGDVTMSDMTIKTNPGSFNSGSLEVIDGLVGFSSITAQYTAEDDYIKVSVDNVEFKGHLNAYHGLKAESGYLGYKTPIPLSNYDIEVTNCSFEGFKWYGVLIMELDEGSITVGTNERGNVFQNNNFVDLGIWHNANVKGLVQGNSFISHGGGASIQLFSAPYPSGLEQVPQTFRSIVYIDNNDFDVADCNGAMIINDNRLIFYPDELSMLVHVKNNRIKAHNPNKYGIVSMNTSGMVIKNNKLSGSGADGIYIMRQKDVSTENGLITENTFSQTSYTGATVHLDYGSRNWTVLGKNQGETVIDKGENNTITGFDLLNISMRAGQNPTENLDTQRIGIDLIRVQ
ncbi:MAG: right-handed parallel beta-helix repeat-containing protein [Candidatus Cyclobacteriaceae bacterium M3_2C_046]